MPEIVQLTAPRHVELVTADREPLRPGSVRVATWYSGVSAGTELTAYRGTNPYLSSTWDAGRRLFTSSPPEQAYPLRAWGYSEVGQVVEVADDVAGTGAAPSVGDVVHGMWGHRSEAVVDAAALAGRVLPPGVDPVLGVFARVGSIALNAVLASQARLGETVAVFGQGVIGLLATRLAVLSGARVVAVDAQPARLERSRQFGAAHVVDAGVEGGAGAVVRGLVEGGVDSAIELSGSDRALHEAVRCVAVEGAVVAAGFYQGGAQHLRLGEEFHHNRVRVVASQISGVPAGLQGRWDQPRLVRTAVEQIAAGALDPRPLITDVLDAAEAPAAFERLDRGDPAVLQVVLRFAAAPGAGR